MDPSLSPTHLFSPSKAREALATAKDWEYVDSWLSTTYARNSRVVPGFERNPETLSALLALASFNEAADEEGEVVSEAEALALEELKTEAANDPDSEMLLALEDSLTPEGRQSLEAVANLSVVLGVPSASTEDLATSLISLTTTTNDLLQAQDRLSALQASLDASLTSLRSLLRTIQTTPSNQTPANLPRQTTSKNLSTKHLQVKLQEYHDRLSFLSAQPSSHPARTTQDVAAQERDVLALEGRVKELERRVKTYGGLPYDKKSALAEFERVRREQAKLEAARDQLFEGLVEGQQEKRAR
ncbi:MAG: hypothetical protein M1817_006762 [Caeruleum heppii]|nr:MAG: hypothetical protein M1817_006762 [Caeruleum heppii]